MDFEVRRDDLRTHRIVDGGAPAVEDGEVLLHAGQCALTANNVTYGAFGDVMGYWNFFPSADGWGRIPVWGFADVEASAVEGIREGERVYGYLPMSTHLVVRAGSVTPSGFVDTAEHRASMSPVYNRYVRFADPLSEHDERVHAVLRPLFTTSFLIDEWLGEEGCFGADAVVVASASSKTALALAASLSANRDVEVIGLTSSRNADFVGRVGYYDRVVTYDDVASLDASVSSVLVDMGGDAAVLAAVHGRLGDALRYSCQVGATHWDQVAMGVELPGPTPQLFFAPDHAQRRIAAWGPAGFEERLGTAWDTFVDSVEGWLRFDVRTGPDEVAAGYEDVLEGRVPPDRAVIIVLDG